MNDPDVKRNDTAKGLIEVLNNIMDAMSLMNKGTFEDKK